MLVLVVLVFLSYLFFSFSKYFEEKSNSSVFSDYLLNGALGLLFLHLSVLFVPIVFNTSWLVLDSLNDTSEYNGTLSNEIGVFQTFSILVWYAYAFFIGFNIVILGVKGLEALGKIPPRGGKYG